MKSLLTSLVYASLCILCACTPEKKRIAEPREPDPQAIGFFCHMGLSEHAGPKGQIVLKGLAEPLWFSSVHDALTYVEMELTSEKDVEGFWVNDMSEGTWEKPAVGAWVQADKAWYVIGSKKTATMGTLEIVPFREQKTALQFIETFGGRMGDYAEARKSLSSEPQPETPGAT